MYTENIWGGGQLIPTKAYDIQIGGTTINNLRYADDTVLLAEPEEDL